MEQGPEASHQPEALGGASAGVGGGLRGPCALRAGEPFGSGPAVAARRELAVSLGGCQAHWTRMSRKSTELVTGRCALPGAPGPVWGPVIPPERGLWLRNLHCSQQSQASGSGSRAGEAEPSDHWPRGLGPGPARVRLGHRASGRAGMLPAPTSSSGSDGDLGCALLTFPSPPRGSLTPDSPLRPSITPGPVGVDTSPIEGPVEQGCREGVSWSPDYCEI